MAYLGFIPTATILPYAGANAPEGWLVCDGQAVSRTTFASLYAALGGASSPFGQGDGSTTFNLPDFRGRFPRFDDNMGSHGVAGVTAAGAASRDTGRTHGSAQLQTTAPNGLGGTAAGQTQGTTATALASGASSVNKDLWNTNQVSHSHGNRFNIGAGSATNVFNLSTISGAATTGVDASTASSAASWTSSNAAGTASGTTNIAHTHAASALTVTGDSETRPINLSVNAIIKI